MHWLVHIPRGLVREFESVLPVWLTATVGDFDSSAVLHRPIYNITGAKRYLLKGMDPHFARLWQINPVDQGKVIGKRSGFSRNLGPAARSRVGYRVQRRYAGGWS